jgi:hypothetical protein
MIAQSCLLSKVEKYCRFQIALSCSGGVKVTRRTAAAASTRVTQILGLGHDIDALLLSWDALFEDYKQFKDAQY